MYDNFDACLSFVLKEEGGYSENSSDPGGITNLGVTIMAWQHWVGRMVTRDEMKALTPDDVTAFYKQKYWEPVQGDQLPIGVDLCLFDAAVNMGPGTSVMMLQKVLGTNIDGVMGPNTLSLLGLNSPGSIVDEFCQERSNRYRQFPTFRVFGKGWLARVQACQQEADRMMFAAAAQV